MTFLTALFVRWGLGQRVSGILAYVIPVAAGIALLWGLCAALIAHGKAIARAECTAAALKASNAALVTNDKAKDQAGVQRGKDTAAIGNEKEVRDDAIKNAPAGNTGAATRAGNCSVWKAGHPNAVPPASCR